MRSLLAIGAAALLATGAASCGSRDESGRRGSRALPGGSRTEVLATIPGDARPPSSAGASMFGLHALSPSGTFELVFGERGGVVYVAEKGEGVQVVHNGRAGKTYSAVGAVVLSPDGRRCAYGALAGGK